MSVESKFDSYKPDEGVFYSKSIARLDIMNNSVDLEYFSHCEICFYTDGGWSGVMFVARSQQDYGSLQCWAENAVGKMAKPCLFHVVPAGKNIPYILTQFVYMLFYSFECE